jgi:hypothetical protein
MLLKPNFDSDFPHDDSITAARRAHLISANAANSAHHIAPKACRKQLFCLPNLISFLPIPCRKARLLPDSIVLKRRQCIKTDA